MFDNLNKQPEDIFAQTDKSAPQVPPPTSPVSKPPITVPVAPQAEPAADTSVRPLLDPKIIQERVAEMNAQHSGGGGLKAVIIILAVIVVIGGAFFISWRILTSRTPVTPEAPELEIPVKEINKQSTQQLQTQPEPQIDLDSDSDGLTDTQEAQLGTSAVLSDTDADGLFDREEVEVYSTDPLNPDSDNDTYVDGAEVEGGYDPNGPGKLLQVPSAS